MLSKNRILYYAGNPPWFFITLICLVVTSVSYGQCTFAIKRSNTNTHCLYAIEEVVWGNATSVAITGNNITKNVASSSWNAGAISVNQVYNNGWVTTVVDEVNTERMIGLSSQATVSVTPAFNRSQFGIMLRSDQRISIYESGNLRSNPSGAYGNNMYANGDIFKIWIDKGVVKYYQNNTLLYISQLTPSTPLVVDATLGTWTPTFASIKQVKVGNGSDGNFTAVASNPGAGATYQWSLNGFPAGTGTSYTNTALNSSHTLRCVLTTNATGCPANASVNSNAITFESVALNTFADYNVLNNPVEYACLASTEPAVFIDLVNTEATGNNLTKNRGVNGWNAGAFSVNTIVNNGYVDAIVPQTNKGIYFGLSKTNPDFNAGKFAFFIRSDVTLEIYESNTLVTSLTGNYGPNTLLRIEVDNNVVKYYTNNTLRYISSVVLTAADFPLHVDVAFNDINGSLNNVTVVNGSKGSFSTRLASVGNSPQYQWKRNGADVVGANASTYNFPALVETDAITCAIDPDLIGCGIVTTPVVGFNRIPFKGTLYVSNEIAPVACAETIENAAFTDIYNVTVSDNDVVKFQGGNGLWNAGVTSLNLIENNGYAKVTVNQTNTAKVFGLSSKNRVLTHTSSANSFIQYGFNFRADSRFEIYEYDGTFYSIKRTDELFNSGDEFKIKVDNGVVRYYRNSGAGDQEVFSSTMYPSLPLVVDISLNTQAPTLARFDDVVISNGSSAIFKANTSNVGPSPDYQWKLNGFDDGLNSQTYSNNALKGGDKITCYVTPDIIGCATGYLSNTVEVVNIGGVTSPSTIWDGSSSSSWSNSNNWSNGVPKGYTKVIIPAGTPNNPEVDVLSSGVYDLSIDPGATLTITGSNSLSVFNTWFNEGALNSNSSTLRFNSCTNNDNTIISLSPESFNNVIVDNANGINVAGNHHIKNHLEFIAGIINYSGLSDLITFDDGSTVAGASVSSHVNGKVRKIGDESFTFPIGMSGIFAPASISAPPSPLDQFDAEYFPSSPVDYVSKDPNTISSVGDCEFWNITGTSPVQVTLSWRATCPHYSIVDVNDLLVVRQSTDVNGNPFWVSEGNGGTTGDAAGGTITSLTASNGQFYSLGASRLPTSLPIELLSFEGFNTREGNMLRWVTASEINNDKFEIESSKQISEGFTKIGEVPGMGTTEFEHEYSFIHQPTSPQTYYRLKQVDFNQTFSYSKVIALTDGFTEDRFEIFPVPVVDSKLYFSRVADVVIINCLGQVLIREKQVDNIDVSRLMPGTYLIRTNTGVIKRFLKL